MDIYIESDSEYYICVNKIQKKKKKILKVIIFNIPIISKNFNFFFYTFVSYVRNVGNEIIFFLICKILNCLSFLLRHVVHQCDRRTKQITFGC